MGGIHSAPVSGFVNAPGLFILPASVSKKGRFFEKLVRSAMFVKGIARPILSSVNVNLEKAGQWDGVIELGRFRYLLEAKAYARPFRPSGRVHCRLREAELVGLDGVVLVAMSGFCSFENIHESKIPLKVLDFGEVSPVLKSGTFFLPTGDICTVYGEGVNAGKGKLLFSHLPVINRTESILFLEDRFFTALYRGVYLARLGQEIELCQIPPFCSRKGEPYSLWEIEDSICGLYSPPTTMLREFFTQEKLDLGMLEGRMLSNMHKVLTHGGRMSLPENMDCARKRIESFPPFAFWRKLRRAVGTVEAAASRAAEIYEGYYPYAENPYNPNKSRCCERYLQVAKCKP